MDMSRSMALLIFRCNPALRPIYSINPRVNRIDEATHVEIGQDRNQLIHSTPIEEESLSWKLCISLNSGWKALSNQTQPFPNLGKN